MQAAIGERFLGYLPSSSWIGLPRSAISESGAYWVLVIEIKIFTGL